MKMPTTKEVSNFELFYDLIFAYAISRITSTLQPSAGTHTIPTLHVFEFLMMTAVFFTIWTYQTVYANRFFTDNLVNSLFMFVDMFFVVILSQSLTVDFEATHPTFAGMSALLFISIGLQYLWQEHTNRDPKRRWLASWSGRTLIILGILAALTIPNWASYPVRFTLYAVVMLSSLVEPIVIRDRLNAVPTAFDHLTERYSLLTLLLFGEGVIAVATTINVHELHITSLLFFITLAMLFLMYIWVYQRGINRQTVTGGLILINVHYFFFVTIPMMTVLLESYAEGHLKPMMYWALMSIAVAVFLSALVVMVMTYHRRPIKLTANQLTSMAGLTALWTVISYLTRLNTVLTMGILPLYLLILLIIWWRVLNAPLKQE